MWMRALPVVLLLATGCRTTAIERDPPRVIASVAAPPAPPPPAAPVTELSNDDVAALVLRDYDRASHLVRGTAIGKAGDVVASNGDVVHTLVDRIHVEPLRGDDWAKGDLLAWVVVGTQPGRCGVGQGFLALLEGERALAIAPWEGSCGTPYRARFVTAAGRALLLEEEDENGGEDGVSEVDDRVWLVSGARWKKAGAVRRTSESAERKMSSTLAADASGIVVTERWHFTPDSTQKTTDRTRALRYTLRGDSLVAPPNADPTP